MRPLHYIMCRNSKSGFTLIEMLVVIAMIGLLSAVILVALGPSRTKAKDTRVISDVNQVRVLAENLFDISTSKYPTCICNNYPWDDCKPDPGFSALKSDVANDGGSFSAGCNNKNTVAVFYSSLPSGGGYCADTAGGAISGTVASSSPPGTPNIGDVCPEQ